MHNILFAADPLCLKHLTGWRHPESPARFTAISLALDKAGLKTPKNTVALRPVTRSELHLCHTEEYIRVVEDDINKLTAMGIVDGQYTLSTGDVQISPSSLECALFAAGAVLIGVDALMDKRAKRIFSLMRPPGHHAGTNFGMGFCIFNSIALGARYAQNKYGIQRVAIVDWDVHHGNGTQEIFDADPSVFYLSTHQKGLYPGTGSSHEKGIGPAVGTKMNFPIVGGQGSRKEVLEAFRGPFVEAMRTFKPELILISAGFDAHVDDPLGGFNLTEEDFAELTRIVVDVAEQYAHGRVLSILEGGYNLTAIAQSAVAHVKALL